MCDNNGNCVVCKATLEEDTITLPRNGPIRIGGGPQKLPTKVVGLYCPNCGLKYKHSPKN